MVKVRGKKVALTPSEYVTKDLVGPKGKRGSIAKKKAALKKKQANGTAQNVGKAPKKNKLASEESDIGEVKGNEIILPEIRFSDAPPPKKKMWRNKQRVLVFGSRGISFRGRHTMDNFRRLLPHTKKESKMDKRDSIAAVNEICEMKNCNKCMFFEGRKQGDIYLWLSEIPEGPSMKFLVENLGTMEELKFTGNCLKGSRALLSFDPTFEAEPHYQLMKEMLMQIFGTPYHHPKSQPFIDHVFTFTVLDNRIWFRNFQIMEEDGSLVEIGPRFCLNPIRIFEGSFGGKTIWSNPHYVPPNKYRAALKKASAGKYINKVQQKVEYERTKPKSSYNLDPSDQIFQVEPEELET
ncbi:Ribosome biogenesis protein BRX1 [Orchesella cincta]|uniref:Ribosome biogenesis protein BRX1 homolog n=1 Tax=Orchesella cincta TaxID=48709 RepID=A0A1D2NEA1_ORCCI|nr:Ribosome biogenesis protein BRX1 [Orchesella cincta]